MTHGNLDVVDQNQEEYPSENNINLMGWSHEGLDDGGQYYYDLAFAVDPNNANKIHVGGVNHWISEDGGYTFYLPL